MTKLEIYSVTIPNKPGEGARLLGAFREMGVNFTAVWGYPMGKTKSRLDVAPMDPAMFKKAAKQLKVDPGKKQIAFHFEGQDHPGAVAEVLAKLAAKQINVYAAQALCAGEGRYGALIQVDPESAAKAAKALAAGEKTLDRQ
jgi:prephenate dehydratase